MQVCQSPDCHVVHDCDVNAACNILHVGNARVHEEEQILHPPLRWTERRMRPKANREAQDHLPRLPRGMPLVR